MWEAAAFFGLEAKHIVDVFPGIHGCFVVADRRVVQFYTQNTVITVFLQHLVIAVNGTVSQRKLAMGHAASS